MSTKPQKRKSVLLRLILLLFSVYIIGSLGNLQIELINSRKELESLTAEQTEKSIKVNELVTLLDNGTEADFIEKAARERLGYVYADEQVYIDLSGN
ncbi:MAG: septum formation initiator family protein [Oscillospiraceae bacterium]|nr:septum formation initiator family protein [Oscillospiraceae bacterium]